MESFLLSRKPSARKDPVARFLLARNLVDVIFPKGKLVHHFVVDVIAPKIFSNLGTKNNAITVIPIDTPYLVKLIYRTLVHKVDQVHRGL